MTLEEKLIEYEPDLNLEWKNMEDFSYLVLDTWVTTNTTTLKWVNSFKALVFGGN